ncbi:hypothetical protein [Umezawaea beigongshangensis]|uniref:hypothetical protein n=1 Tax=Umezawaea beigongshangensis TaxID=2780383 RepID=UPI0018F10A43|nr:hypothetical protein [Umezawaea beigongshangensis]
MDVVEEPERVGTRWRTAASALLVLTAVVQLVSFSAGPHPARTAVGLTCLVVMLALLGYLRRIR